MKSDEIRVIGAQEKNLKNVSLSIPKKQITVVTGVSGSGKSAMVFDTIAAESQRQINETYTSFIRHRLPQYGHPKVDSIENLPMAIVINQKRLGGNARSTVGTVTDINPLLRLLFSRIGSPFVGHSEVFSFNNPKGMCPKCEGLGKVNVFRIENLIDKEKSLNEGAIQFPTFRPGDVRWKRYVSTGLFDNDKKLKDYSEEEWDILLYQTGFKPPNPTVDWPPTSTYEGIIPRIERTFLKKGVHPRYKDAITCVVAKGICPMCHGDRLNPHVLSCKINGKTIADCTRMQIGELLDFIRGIDHPAAATLVQGLIARLEQILAIGIGYVTLDRETVTLSGGESQRLKMVRQLGSSLTDLLYILDEPSVGLHPHDIHHINRLLKQLRDKGNTVLIVEHDPDIIRIADHVIDMGPKAGKAGGQVVYEGSLEGLEKAGTLTGNGLKQRPQLKKKVRKPMGWLLIEHASMHNLKGVTVRIPTGVLTAVTGVAGSGKSTLIHHVFSIHYPEAVFIDQGVIHASPRSNIATFTGMFDSIRRLFAKQNGVSASLFSFNAKGACPECKGAGTILTDLAFMDTITTVCEGCGGRRFHEEVLHYGLRGKNINDVLAMTVDEALEFFSEEDLQQQLQRLKRAGLGYMSLGQPLDTLSGGERQRVKLAAKLEQQGEIYVLDEPSTGLHFSDCDQLMNLIHRLVEQGNTVIIVEHNLDLISQADWIIDLGPGAGQDGGNVIFSGTPRDLIQCQASITGKYLKEYIVER